MTSETNTKKSSAVRYYTFAEMKRENLKSNTSLVVIENCVYDLHGFLRDHPGGEEVITEHVGKDATGAFFAVGHSSDAKGLLGRYKVGELVHSERL